MRENNERRNGWRAAIAGQAMLEYAMLTSIVVIAGLSVYMTGWFEGVQNYIYDVLLCASLPMP